MKIVASLFYIEQLQNILRYIALDNPYAALGFEKELSAKLHRVKDSPLMCRQSIYFDNGNFRDLIHKGYTVIYKIDNSQLILLDIFKWQGRA